jgi:hypothetical protein
MPKTVMVSIEEKIKEFEMCMRGHRYRPPVKEDLKPGTEILMVDVEQYMRDVSLSPDITATRIRLDENCLAPSKTDAGKEMVFYHCIMPEWRGQCFVSVQDFCTSGYVRGFYTNDTRYVIKK